MSFQFTSPYDAQSVLRFLGNNFLPNDFTEHAEPLEIEFKPLYMQNAKLLGDCPSLELKVFEIQHQSENDPRVGVSKDLFRLMSLYRTMRAIAILTSSKSQNYRLSLATIDFVWEGKKITKEYSNPRRYSFYLGPDCKEHTPYEFLINKGRIKDFNDLLQRFSIEVVNKEFYNAIAMRFTELVGGERKIGSKVIEKRGTLKLPGTNDHLKKQEFAVRLIGRLVFCWFLKKKRSVNGCPLISDEIISKNSITDLYYHDVLENLFFQVLNTPMDQRKAEFRKAPWKDVPFLNGGLFEPHEDDYYDADSFLGKSKHLNTLVVKDKWFEELFELFETYNFTIDENTSIDIELSVEPEMLGRIFENLLAEINPETGESARKSTGSFYTPRPIVEYMVDESIKQYLHTHTGITPERLAGLLSYSHDTHDLSEKEQKDVMKALQQVKILDPACGSGAFPMGALQKILLMLQKIDPKAQESLKKVLKAAPDATIREMLRRKLEGEKDLWDYTRKLSVIQQSIYGVDIQPIAVEISKLRFFLSLVVDEKIDDNKDNRGIEPLPNLEFKFVCANTLIGLPKPTEQVTFFDEMQSIDKLGELRDEYFSSSGKAKLKIERDIKNLQTKMFKDILHWQRKGENYDDSQAMKLVDWDPFTDKASSWFDPDWMFGIKNGFDVVIGNPPYVEHKKLKQFSKLFKENFNTYSGTADLYVYFIEKGIKLLRNKGIITFITSNKFIKTSYGENLRGFLSSKDIIQIIDFSIVHVFDALVASCILIVKNKNPEGSITVSFVDDNLTQFGSLSDFIVQNNLIIDNAKLDKNIWQLESNTKLLLKDKIESGSIKLKNIDTINIYRGVTTGYNPAFIIDEEQKKQLIKEDKTNKEIIKPLLQGRNIRKWNYIHTTTHIIFTRKGISINDYPIIKKHLLYFKKELEPGKGRKPGAYNWYEIQDNTAYYHEFEKEKIIWGLTADKWAFAYDDEGHYLTSNGYILTSKEIPIKYLLAIMNSKLMEFYFGFIGIMTAGGAFTLKYETIVEFPLKLVSQTEQKSFIKIVDQLLPAKKKNPQADTSELEQEIDVMVYKLYEITYDEVKIVDPAFGLSREEWERTPLTPPFCKGGNAGGSKNEKT